jgi:hypothetical protein
MIQQRNLTTFVITVLALMPVATSAQRMRPGPMRVAQRPVKPLSEAHRASGDATGNGVRTREFEPGAMDSTQTATPHQAALATAGGYPLSVQDLLNITPNSGFDWEHVNAINADLPIKAFIDPVTQLEVAQAVHLLRLTAGGFPAVGGVYYLPSETEEQQPVEEPQSPANEPARPQVIIVQQEPPQPTLRTSGEIPGHPDMPDRDGLVLVLRSGKQIEVAAFTRAKDRILYVTAEGHRMAIAASDLDPEATVRVNRERGTMLQLPSSTK